jgi:hypothetical protein
MPLTDGRCGTIHSKTESSNTDLPNICVWERRSWTAWTDGKGLDLNLWPEVCKEGIKSPDHSHHTKLNKSTSLRNSLSSQSVTSSLMSSTQGPTTTRHCAAAEPSMIHPSLCICIMLSVTDFWFSKLQTKQSLAAFFQCHHTACSHALLPFRFISVAHSFPVSRLESSSHEWILLHGSFLIRLAEASKVHNYFYHYFLCPVVLYFFMIF